MTVALPRRRRGTARLSAGTAAWEALPIWIASRIAVGMAGLGAAWVLHGRQARDVPSWLGLWQHWDANLFVKVAQFGYPPTTAYSDRTEVDFPGMPIVLRVVHAVTGNWTVAGLLVSLVAGGIAACALYHLAATDDGPEAGKRAVLYLVCFPYAVFLFAGYSEGLFLAFATTSWVYARKGRWTEASLLCAGAAATRVLGLCLAAGLAVEYVASQWRAGGFRNVWRWKAWWLVTPALPVLLFVWYLHERTGRWDAYQQAQKIGWHRETAWFTDGWRTVMFQAKNGFQSGQYAWSWRAEMIAVLLGALVCVLLLFMRRFGEAVFVGTSAALLGAQNYYASSVRAALVWFPIYLLLAKVTVRREWAHQLVLAVSAPLMFVFVVVFTLGGWVG